MCSINASPIPSTVDLYIGTVIKLLVTSSIIHKMNLCPLLDCGVTFKIHT